MDIDFRLFQDQSWVNSWRLYKDDTNLKVIAPLIDSYANKEIGYFVFKSLFTSNMTKILPMINLNHVMCTKRGNMLIFAYGVGNETMYYDRNEILDLFLNAVYEMVVITSGRGYYEIPQIKYVN